MKNRIIGQVRVAAAWMLAIWCAGASAAGVMLQVGAGHYDTISNAVSAASDGDTIVILAATQTECGIVITKSLTIQGQGMTNTIVQGATTRSNATDRIFMMNNAAKTLTIKNLTLQYGCHSNNSVSWANYGGAALYNAGGTVTVQNCRVMMNDTLHLGYERASGGAFCQYNYDNPGGSLFAILNCLVVSNTADYSTGSGGGIDAREGVLWIEGSTFINNHCVFSSGSGGGAVRFGNLNFLTIRNSTLFANVCDYHGGGIFGAMLAGCTGTVYNSTIYSNTSAYSGQEIYATAGSLEIYSSIVAGGISPLNVNISGGGLLFSNCFLAATAPAGVITNNCLYGDPKLLGLADNGGPATSLTRTLALQSSSPCINVGLDPLGLVNDQRGYARDSHPDIGAYEYGARANNPNGSFVCFW